MKNTTKTIFTEEPKEIADAFDNAVVVADFLPPPSQLVKKKPKERVNIMLNPDTVSFFKRQAKKNNTQYQTMINMVLDQYAKHYSQL